MNINELIFSKKNNINLNNSNINNNIDVSKINKSLNYKIIKEYNTKISSDLNMSDYQIISMIGSGSFANIYLVSEIKTKKKYAIKKIIADGEEDLKKFKSTIEIIQTLCPNNNIYNNIIPILKYVIKKIDATAYSIYILMPLATCDWYKTIQDNTIIYDEKTLRKILSYLVKGFSYMQEKKIAHRDIKPANILILNDKDYYIGDFGESINVKSDYGTFDIRGTKNYMSPILEQNVITGIRKIKHNVYKSDVYSLGLCFVYAMTKKLDLFDSIRKSNNDEDIRKIVMENVIYKKGYSEEFYNILLKMITPDEKDRVDFIQLNNLI
jgi:translation initiation factor 2-alpha kinase 4